MGTSMRSWYRFLAFIICLLLALSPGARLPVYGAQRDGRDAVDFAAMTLTPEDLSEIGLEDYRLIDGKVIYFDDVVAFVAQDIGATEDEVADQLSEVGFVYWYQSKLYLPGDGDAPDTIAEREVLSYVMEFADGETAAQAWNLLQDESGNDDSEDLAGAEEFGDRSEVTLYLTQHPDTGDDVLVLDVTFLLDNLMVGVRLFERDGTEPELRDGEALAGRLQQRVEQVLEDGGPGLSRQALRLTGDAVESSVDNYLLLAGDAIQFYYETSEDSRQREEESADIEETDEYAVWQQIASLEEGQEDDVWYMLTIRRFEDEAGARDWLQGVESEIADNPAYSDFEIDERAPQFGDESLSFSMEWAEQPIANAGVALRMDNVVATIYLQGPETPPSDALEALAEAQVPCLEEGCDEPLDVPGELEEYVDELAGLPPVTTTSAQAYVNAPLPRSAAGRSSEQGMTGGA